MGKGYFKADRSAIDALLNSGKVRQIINERTQAIGARVRAYAGEGDWKADVQDHGRPVGMVATNDFVARRANAKHQYIERSIDAGRG